MNTYGNCDNKGDEFNPLAPDAKNPYSQYSDWKYEAPREPEGRGYLDSFTTDSSAMYSYWMQYFLQNLEGKDSIIGRSISLDMEGM